MFELIDSQPQKAVIKVVGVGGGVVGNPVPAAKGLYVRYPAAPLYGLNNVFNVRFSY